MGGVCAEGNCVWHLLRALHCTSYSFVTVLAFIEAFCVKWLDITQEKRFSSYSAAVWPSLHMYVHKITL